MRTRWLLTATLATAALAACTSSAAMTGASETKRTTAGSGATTPPPASVGGTGDARGFDCATLLTPAELDAASGLSGGTVKTNRRGDQPADGDVMGVTECAIDYSNVANWSGHFDIATGNAALENFDAAFAFAKANGATPLAGVGAEAVIKVDDIGVHAWARGPNGVAATIAIGFDDSSASADSVKSAASTILSTALAAIK